MAGPLTREQGNFPVAIRNLLNCFYTVFKAGFACKIGSAPTVHLQSWDQLQNTLQQQTSRSRRSGKAFSLLTIALSQNHRDDRCRRLLAGLLQRRLRLCDEAGYLDNENIAVVLPATARCGALKLAGDLQQMLDQHNIVMRYTVDEFPAEHLTQYQHGTSPEQAAPLVLFFPTLSASLDSSHEQPT